MNDLRFRISRNNATLVSSISKRVSQRKPVRFLPHMVKERDYGVRTGYHLLLFGILESGEPATICISGIKPAIFIRCPACSNKTEIQGIVATRLRKENVRYTSMSLVKGTYFVGYNPEETFLKVEFSMTATRNSGRRRALELLQDSYQIADNSKYSYYLTVGRNHNVALGCWGKLQNYRYVKSARWGYGHCFVAEIRSLPPIPDNKIMKHDLLTRPYQLSCGFDIECRKGNGESGLPKPEIYTDEMFMICLSFFWERYDEPVYNVCLCLYEATVPEDAPTMKYVACETERDLILEFANVLRETKPDFMMGFNDGGFDWPWILFRADKYGIAHNIFEALSRTSYRRSLMPEAPVSYTKWAQYRENPTPVDYLAKRYYCYYSRRIKLENKKFAMHTMPSVDGTIFVDMMQLMIILYPGALSKSLNSFLEMLQLPVKLDINPHQLFTRAENSRSNSDPKTLEDMGEIAHYCAVDAMSPVRMFYKRAIPQEKRAEAALFAVSLKEAYFSTDRDKVTNLMLKEAKKMGFLSPSASEDNEKVRYDGGLVLKPKKGLVISKLALRERLRDVQDRGVNSGFSKQFLCPEAEQFVKNAEQSILHGKEQEFLAHMNDSPMRTTFENFLQERMLYPVSGMDFSSLYPSLMRAYALSADKMLTETLHGKDVRKIVKRLQNEGKRMYYTTYIDSYGTKRESWAVQPSDENPDDMGTYGLVLGNLKRGRVEIKRKMLAYKYAMEAIRAQGLDTSKSWSPKELVALAVAVNANADAVYLMSVFEVHGKLQSVRSIKMFHSMYHAQQLKRKLAMNTLYGAAGFESSPLYIPELAAAVTISGQNNLRLVKEHCEINGFEVHYGDTDSVYISCPPKTFADLDRLYYGGQMTRTKYWEGLISSSMPIFHAFQDELNAVLVADNGTQHLKIVYEEALYPVFWVGRKMYVGHEHENVPSVENPHIFMRGVDIVRRDRSKTQKSVSRSFFDKVLSVHNRDSVLRCAELAVHHYFETDFGLEDFSKHARYMPISQEERDAGNGNIAILNFADRMKARGVPLVPGDKFQYIVANVPQKYLDTTTMRIVKLKKSDMWETVEYAREHGIQVNKVMYFDGISHALARYVGYLPMFNSAVEMSYEERDASSISAAEKFLRSYALESGLVGDLVLNGNEMKARHKDKVRKEMRELAGRGVFTTVPQWLVYSAVCGDLAEKFVISQKPFGGGGFPELRKRYASLWIAVEEKFRDVCSRIPDPSEELLEEHLLIRRELNRLKFRSAALLCVCLSNIKYLEERKSRTRIVGMTPLDKLWEKKMRAKK